MIRDRSKLFQLDSYDDDRRRIRVRHMEYWKAAREFAFWRWRL